MSPSTPYKNQSKRGAHKPEVMPRPSDKELEEAVESRPDPGITSPLDVYMKNNSLSSEAMSKALGVHYKTVMDLRKADAMPSLAAAFHIERCTKGVVAVEMWLAMPKVKAQLREWMEKQPEGVREFKSEIPAGGFSSPPEKSRRGERNDLKKKGGA